MPARIDTRVDLPEPFGPMSPMRSPSEITIERLSKSFRTPNVLLMFWQLMSDMRRTGSGEVEFLPDFVDENAFASGRQRRGGVRAAPYRLAAELES